MFFESLNVSCMLFQKLCEHLHHLCLCMLNALCVVMVESLELRLKFMDLLFKGVDVIVGGVELVVRVATCCSCISRYSRSHSYGAGSDLFLLRLVRLGHKSWAWLDFWWSLRPCAAYSGGLKSLYTMCIQKGYVLNTK